MADLKTKYLGIDVKNPIIAGASRLTSNLEKMKELEEAGVAAIVCASLFEEQIQLKNYQINKDSEKMTLSDSDPEMHRSGERQIIIGPDEHLMWLQKSKETLSIPIIGSLNAVNEQTWLDYARKIEDTGVDALECNFYFVPGDPQQLPEQIESRQLKTMEKIKKTVSIPVAVKLSYFYTNPLGFIQRAAGTGIDGLVLFNRLFEPDIDIQEHKHSTPLNLSSPGDVKLSLRYAGMLFGTIKADIIAGTGIFSVEDVIKAILAGASSVQVVSSLFRHGTRRISELLKGLQQYMDRNSIAGLSGFQGRLARKNITDPFVYKRAQYINLLLKSELLE